MLLDLDQSRGGIARRGRFRRTIRSWSGGRRTRQWWYEVHGWEDLRAGICPRKTQPVQLGIFIYVPVVVWPVRVRLQFSGANLYIASVWYVGTRLSRSRLSWVWCERGLSGRSAGCKSCLCRLAVDLRDGRGHGSKGGEGQRIRVQAGRYEL